MCDLTCNECDIIAAPKKPTLAETYKLTVECNFQDKNYTTDFTEYFDYPNQRVAVHQWDAGFHAYGIYNYNTSQLLTVIAQTGKTLSFIITFPHYVRFKLIFKFSFTCL